MKTQKKKTNLLFFILLLIIFMAGSASPLLAQTPVRIAFLSMDNLSTDPRYDYLSGIVQGILLFDLSNQDGLEMVDRADLDSVLEEQKLALSGLIENTRDALAVGEILRANYLLKG